MVLRSIVRISRNYTRLCNKLNSSAHVIRLHASQYCQPTMEPTVITKSLNDKREYRLVVLENGLRALLISDLDGEDQSSFVDHDIDQESEEESDHSEASGGDDDMTEVTDKPALGEKKSAVALCIGMGSFSDPDDIPGFAHFLEHMVFMGSERYPDVNCHDDYLGKHGGESNAWTDNEKTCFHFHIERNYLRKAMDIFADFFTAPLLQKEWVDQELQAVDSEYQQRLPEDPCRLNQLIYSTAKPGHPMAKFLYGNLDSLKNTPTSQGIDMYGSLRDFYNRNYSAQYMTLAVHSRHRLDTLESWVRESFSGIPNNKQPQPCFKDLKDPFDTDNFRKFYKVIPVENTHKVIITWAFPPLQHHYRKKPLEYISSLVSHEGTGSILAYLKKRNWAVELSGGNTGKDSDNNSTCSEFDISITLSDLGLQNYKTVIKTVFEYLAMLRDVGPQEWFYKELQTVEEANFRWKEQGDPEDYVQTVCVNMHNYAVEDCLTGHRLYRQYDQKLIQECLDYLRADNCNVMLVSSDFTESDCPEKEHWFQAQYSSHDLDPALLQEWKEAKQNPELSMPAPNKFIATDFSLKPSAAGEQSLLPVELLSTPHCKLFYKKDNKFNVPKGHVYLYLRNTVVKESAKNLALFGLFETILCQKVDEIIYPAVLAGYEVEIEIDADQSGLVIEINGFNDKIQHVLNEVVEAINQFSCTDEQFLAMRSHLKKEFYNEMIKQYEAAFMVRHSIIKRTYWSCSDRYAVVDTLTKDDLTNLVNTFHASLHMDCLVVGNFTAQEARDLCKSVCSQLKGISLSADSLLQNTILEIPIGKHYCQVPGFNPEDQNSCITNYYQSEPRTLEKSCLNEVLETRIREPAFNTLRTKHQLGYSVYTKNYDTCGIIALGIFVEYQASKFSMARVDGLIEDFLQEMKDDLASMSEEEFNDLIDSVITLKKTEDTHLGEEASRHWREIEEQSFLFDRHQKEIAVLKTLTQASLQRWFTQYLGDQQRKLSIQILGKTSEKSDGPSPVKHPSDQEVSIKYLVDPEQKSSVAITDLNSFKNSLKHLPSAKLGT